MYLAHSGRHSIECGEVLRKQSVEQNIPLVETLQERVVANIREGFDGLLGQLDIQVHSFDQIGQIAGRPTKLGRSGSSAVKKLNQDSKPCVTSYPKSTR